MSIGMGSMGGIPGNAAGMASGLKGTGYKQVTTPTKTGQQQQLLQQLLQALGQRGLTQGIGHLGKLAGGDQDAFSESEAPAYRMFDELMGSLGNRFAEFAPGAMSSKGGSGFQQAGTSAAQGLAENLASRRMDIQRQSIMDLMGMSNDLLGQNTFETGFVPKKQSWWKSLLGGLGGGLAEGVATGGTLLGMSKFLPRM